MSLITPLSSKRIRTQFELTAICERSNKLAHKRYPKARILDDIIALLADEEIELVVINTPDESHHPYVERAIQYGKYVIVEKPFTYTTITPFLTCSNSMTSTNQPRQGIYC